MKQPVMIERKGEVSVSNSGQKMTIVDYIRSNNITIMFEDGTTVYNKSYANFVKGNIKHPNLNTINANQKENRLHEKTITKQGYIIEIIEYNSYSNILVKFPDGSTKKTDYRTFKNGTLTKPVPNHVGETCIAKNGLLMEIIAYRTYSDIDVKFETGEVRTGVGYKEFKNGNVALKPKHVDNSSRIGESVVAKNGLKATIVGYRNSRSIDVEFEDGVVVTNKSYSDFKNGYIAHPTTSIVNSFRNKRIGETRIANNGLKMTIIEYKGVNAVTVQFETGEVREGVTYKAFKAGHVNIVNSRIDKTERIGESKIANNGLKMTIIDYASSLDVTVEFETGEIKKGVRYGAFIDGTVKATMSCGDVSIGKVAYRYNDEINFFCHCNRCGHDDIMTVSEMKNHKCEKL